MDKFYSLDELAKAGNATPRAIRLYIDKRLLEPMRVEELMADAEVEVSGLRCRLSHALKKEITP